MIATREPGAPVSSLRQYEPPPPSLRFTGRADACAVAMAFNGVEYRAVVEVRDGVCRPSDVAAMLRRIADEVGGEG